MGPALSEGFHPQPFFKSEQKKVFLPWFQVRTKKKSLKITEKDAVDNEMITLSFNLVSSQLFHKQVFLLRITFNSEFF